MSSKTAKLKDCSGCSNKVPINSKYNTCDYCRKRAAEKRKARREAKIECQAIKKDGDKCTNEVKEKCGNKYCAKHERLWKEENEDKKMGKKLRRCNSQRMCDPSNPKVKAILPDGYEFAECKNCLKESAIKDKQLRESKIKKTETSKKYYFCTKCSKDKKYKHEEMGLKNDGTRSHLCQNHFDKSKEADLKRNKPTKQQDSDDNDSLSESDDSEEEIKKTSKKIIRKKHFNYDEDD